MTYLIVHEFSYTFVTRAVGYILERLQEVYGSKAKLLLVSAVEQAEIEDGSLVFIIGEVFDPFPRQVGCRYVYLNYSVLLMMGNPFMFSRSGLWTIRRKYKMLMDKAAQFDAVLEYYPEQEKKLARRLPVPVLGFPTAIASAQLPDPVPLSERPYDVCFVGGLSPRRQKILAQLQDAGLTVSPTSGVVFEEIAGQSRVTLNVHKFRANHVEYPRMIGALAAGSALVTENSYGLHTRLPRDILVSARYGQLVRTLKVLLTDAERLEQLAIGGRRWSSEVWEPECTLRWQEICAELETL